MSGLRRCARPCVQSGADHFQRFGILRDRLATGQELRWRLVEQLEQRLEFVRVIVVIERLGRVIWIAVGGILAALLLVLIALIAVIGAARPVVRHANALVPDRLRAKFARVPHDVTRIQGAIVSSESLLVRAHEAIERIRVDLRRA